MITQGRYDHDVLIGLGAVKCVYYGDANETEITPDIDLSGYGAALAAATVVRDAESAKRVEITQAKADARADTFVQQFVNMTPAQVIAYVNANVGNLADAKQLLTKLALMMLALAKEQYK